jgi:hypothetical protein
MSERRRYLADRSRVAFSSVDDGVEVEKLMVCKQVQVAQLQTFNSVLRFAPEKQ